MLHKFENNSGKELYCGPHAICALTGHEPKDVCDLIIALRQRGLSKPGGAISARLKHSQHVKMMWMEELQAFFEQLGYSCRMRSLYAKHTTLAGYCAMAALEDQEGLVGRIIRVSGHFIAVSPCGQWVSDTWTKHPKPYREGPRLRSKITHELKVFV